MKKYILPITLLLAGCGASVNDPIVINQNSLSTAQLVVSGLRSIDGLLKVVPGVSSGDIFLADSVLAVTSDGLAKAQAGTITNGSLASLIVGEVTQLAPVILTDLKANSTITTGVEAVLGVLPILMSDAGIPAPSKTRFGAKTTPVEDLREFVMRHPTR